MKKKDKAKEHLFSLTEIAMGVVKGNFQLTKACGSYKGRRAFRLTDKEIEDKVNNFYYHIANTVIDCLVYEYLVKGTRLEKKFQETRDELLDNMIKKGEDKIVDRSTGGTPDSAHKQHSPRNKKRK